MRKEDSSTSEEFGMRVGKTESPRTFFTVGGGDKASRRDLLKLSGRLPAPDLRLYCSEGQRRVMFLKSGWGITRRRDHPYPPLLRGGEEGAAGMGTRLLLRGTKKRRGGGAAEGSPVFFRNVGRDGDKDSTSFLKFGIPTTEEKRLVSNGQFFRSEKKRFAKLTTARQPRGSQATPHGVFRTSSCSRPKSPSPDRSCVPTEGRHSWRGLEGRASTGNRYARAQPGRRTGQCDSPRSRAGSRSGTRIVHLRRTMANIQTGREILLLYRPWRKN